MKKKKRKKKDILKKLKWDILVPFFLFLLISKSLESIKLTKRVNANSCQTLWIYSRFELLWYRIFRLKWNYYFNL